jgi:UDP-glucose 4-epimerase
LEEWHVTILVTGGSGYIGSHTCVELLQAGYEVVIVDNFSNSHPAVLDRIKELTGKDFSYAHLDLLERDKLEKVFRQYDVEAVIHCAGFKAVSESVKFPLKYYNNNVTGTIVLCEVMQAFGVKKIVFSSSATVYGVPESDAIPEEAPLAPVNPYGRTKYIIEQMLQDLYQADDEWSVALLRYFNPIGAHSSGLIGDAPNGIPNNLMPYLTQVAVGKREKLHVFGNDYDTHDGTGVRDYIHVVDLAIGHLKALEKVLKSRGIHIYNLGTGTGCSVLDIIRVFEKVTGVKIPYEITERRQGDVAKCVADPTKANKELGWKASRTLADMCRDAWNWQQKNPNGYE